MSGLILPPAAQAAIQVRRDSQSAKALDRALKDHDPNLSLVWIMSDIPQSELPNEALPGRWHVRQQTILGPRYIPITQPDGSYREPDFGVLMEMQQRDTWKNGRPEGTQDDLEALRAKERSLADEQRLDEMKADFRAAKRVAGDGGVRKRRWGRGLSGT